MFKSFFKFINKRSWFDFNVIYTCTERYQGTEQTITNKKKEKDNNTIINAISHVYNTMMTN